MRVERDSAFLEIERLEVGAPDNPVDHDLLLNVTVKVASYSAADQCWIAASDFEEFLLALRSLERQRQGEAVLVGANPEDLRLESLPLIPPDTWQYKVMLVGRNPRSFLYS